MPSMYLAAGSPNPLIPHWPELIIGSVSFLIVFALLARVLMPRISSTLAERTDHIEGGLKRAEDAQAEANRVLEQYRAQLADARHEAARLREQAKEEAAQIVAQGRADGVAERERIIASANSQIEADRQQALTGTAGPYGRPVPRRACPGGRPGDGRPMRGASRASLIAAKERLSAALAGGTAAQANEVGDQLLAVVGLLDREPGLRRSLSDPSRERSARTGLADALLAGKISATTLGLVTELVGARWSEPGDLTDAGEQLAVLAIAEAADSEGELDELEDELFRFGRIVQGNPGLRSALSNQFVPEEGRSAVVTELVSGKVSASALRLITQAAAHSRGRSLDAVLESYASLAAGLRERLVAEVHVAVPLSNEQRDRLAAALVAAYGHDVHLNVVIDPEMIGGVSVRIGDELINGSIASRLADLRRGLAA